MADRMSRADLVETLRWMALLIERDDSADGTLTYSWSPEPGVYEVEGLVRYGNSQGQGSVRLLSDPSRQITVHDSRCTLANDHEGECNWRAFRG